MSARLLPVQFLFKVSKDKVSFDSVGIRKVTTAVIRLIALWITLSGQLFVCLCMLFFITAIKEIHRFLNI